MAFSYQYNKSSLFTIQKQLDIRVKSLPVLKSKETALRHEVKKNKHLLETMREEYHSALSKAEEITYLCSELDASLIQVSSVESDIISISGVKVPELRCIIFEKKTFNLFIHPYWFAEGVLFLEKMITMKFNLGYIEKRIELLEKARKKTTQKVNLYEKNQIPEFNAAIIKIKRFLDDEENLSKAAQKILKAKVES